MLQVGIFNGYFPYPLVEQARRIRALGFNTVQLDFNIKGMDFATPDAVTRDKARHVQSVFRDHDLPICCLAVPTNLVHPDRAKRRELLDLLKAFIRRAREFGSPYVVSETGTFNTASDWVSHPRNKTEEGFEDCRNVIAELARVAHDHGAVFVIETYVNNVIGSVEETVRLFAEVDHPGLGLLMDPTNYFEAHNIDRMDAVLKQIFDTLGNRILIAHAKDVKRSGEDKSEKHADIDAAEGHTFRGVGEIELPAPGLGVLNYDYYLRRLAAKHPNIPIIIEHLDEGDVPRAKRFLDDKLRTLGI
jgi:sugar phosphate isomerase/epimerase